ncbi:MAG TPA: transcriptional repressor LexA [Planctomycetota bacterium]|nr:transcriptional repressor LexA [Planctomycetota bacterium]
MTEPLTKRQKEIFDFLRAYADDHGYAPTLDEIGARFGISKATAFEHVKALQDKSRIEKTPNRSRSIQFSGTEPAAPASPPPAAAAPSLPVVGRVAAGRPIEAVEDRDPQSLLDLIPADGCFALRVEGESMIDDQIRDGDFVILENRKDPRNGETVVALIDRQEATLKRWHRVGREVRLEPRNPTLKPMTFDASRIEVCGVLVGLVRRY